MAVKKTKERQKINSGLYKIEKGIEIVRKKTITNRFPFEKMDIGDSFLIPKNDQDPLKARASIYAAVKSFNTFNSKTHKVSSRVEEGGLRVWRIG